MAQYNVLSKLAIETQVLIYEAILPIFKVKRLHYKIIC